ncbi:hypothetical protein TNIN_469481 [Trichonephila inaurata madagascariensis]|uniref:Uncharacterized protein n=1 Tax=Trichonephila inaurata madagascariensis TaxID=2747483 RepID=A0A8X7BT35_9ARAC|nr:hypothetical protein TNIN_469481 [Trichonephila inaurata madagascariensis]
MSAALGIHMTLQESECSDRLVVDEALLRELVKEDQYSTPSSDSSRSYTLMLCVISRAMHCINLTYMFKRWMLHAFTQTDKDSRAQACTNLLEYLRKDDILDRIVTFDEK